MLIVRAFRWALALVVLSLVAVPALALEYEARVFLVSDADTVRVAVTAPCPLPACPAAGETLRVRLAEIDAPEDDQPYGRIATAHLEELIGGAVVTVHQTDIDRYGRVVAHLQAGDVWVNAWLVGEGHAWVYPQFARSPELFALEEQAREAGVGLWATPGPVEPWLWRRR